MLIVIKNFFLQKINLVNQSRERGEFVIEPGS